MEKCKCGEKLYAKGLCEKCYRKEYCQRPKVKKRKKEYNKEYNQKNRVKLLKYQRENYVSVCLAGQGTNVFTNGATQEIKDKKLVQKIKDKILNKAVNDKKYLRKLLNGK